MSTQAHQTLTDGFVAACCPSDLADGAEYTKEMESAVSQCETAVETWLESLDPTMPVGDALRELRLFFASR